MQTLARTGLAALLAAPLLATAAAPSLAQPYGGQGYGGQGYGGQPGYDRQAYPPPTYDRAPGPPQGGYDRNGYPPSTYDAGRAPPPGGYDRDGGAAGPANDPQDLARRLNLSPSQRGAFDAYRRAFAPDQARAQREEDEMRRMSSLPTPQRLDLARAALARDRDDFERTDAATRAFYSQLSPAQRRTFDELTAPQMDEGGAEPGGPSPTQPAGRPPR